VAVIKRVCDETPRPIREVNPDIPRPLCQLIERLHAKKPADRPASAKEVADLLTQLLANLSEPRTQRSGVSGPRSAAHSAALRARLGRHKWPWAAAALVLLFVGLGLGEATGVSNLRGTVTPLKPGPYRVEASRDGEVVRQEWVTVSRTGCQAARLSTEVEPTAAKQWERSVAELPADEQVKAVARRLQELNPGFDGKVTPSIKDGVVTGLRFNTDAVEDISPLRALTGLVTLECPGTFPRKGKLSDLTPLCGLRLTHLNCGQNPVTDLSPLWSMPLTVLVAEDTRVSDLSPLQGMGLKVLTLQSTGVKNLSPLRGMPLQWLDLYGVRGVSDISPLKGMPLEYLNLTALPVSDLSLLAGMKSLRRLILDSMPASDLTPLRGLGLKELSFTGTQVTDLSPLKGLPLRRLRLDYRADREEFVRSFKGLEFINEKPAAGFWKGVAGK
jgi:hypothetical protein